MKEYSIKDEYNIIQYKSEYSNIDNNLYFTYKLCVHPWYGHSTHSLVFLEFLDLSLVY